MGTSSVRAAADQSTALRNEFMLLELWRLSSVTPRSKVMPSKKVSPQLVAAVDCRLAWQQVSLWQANLDAIRFFRAVWEPGLLYRMGGAGGPRLRPVLACALLRALSCSCGQACCDMSPKPCSTCL